MIPKAKLNFWQLNQVFIKAFIIYQFNIKHFIQIETNIFDYDICGIFNQLTSKFC